MSTKLSDYKIKVVASNVRDMDLQKGFIESPEKYEIIHGNAVECDVGLFKALDDFASYDRVENIHGRSVKIYAGDYIVGVFGNRHSAQNLCGHISGESTKSIFNLLTNGGFVGICDDSPIYMGSPMKLECLGLIAQNGKKINTLKLNYNVKNIPYMVMVCGTSGETGKTTVAKNIIRYLKRISNYKIAGVKLAGTGCMEDILEHIDAGSDVVYDLSDAGLISSYSTADRVVNAVKTILGKVYQDGVDICICEYGGDIIAGNVFNTLQDEFIMSKVFNIVMTYNDVMGLMMAQRLFDEYGVNCKIDIAQNINHNVFGDLYRLNEWSIKYKSYDVNHEDNKAELAKSILEEYEKIINKKRESIA